MERKVNNKFFFPSKKGKRKNSTSLKKNKKLFLISKIKKYK